MGRFTFNKPPKNMNRGKVWKQESNYLGTYSTKAKTKLVLNTDLSVATSFTQLTTSILQDFSSNTLGEMRKAVQY